MIVCVAIKYHINKTNSDVVLCGWRHADIIGQLISLGFQKGDFSEIEQGFIDHTGKFLDRYDAYAHACSCGQLSLTTRENHYGSQLFSEDLY